MRAICAENEGQRVGTVCELSYGITGELECELECDVDSDLVKAE